MQALLNSADHLPASAVSRRHAVAIDMSLWLCRVLVLSFVRWQRLRPDFRSESLLPLCMSSTSCKCLYHDMQYQAQSRVLLSYCPLGLRRLQLCCHGA